VDINIFHLTVGKMRITLHVSTLLYIFVVGQFYTYLTLNFTTTSIVLVELLRMDFGDATTEIRHYHGAHMRLGWL